MSDKTGVPEPRKTDEILESLDLCRALVREPAEQDVRVHFRLVDFDIIGDIDLAGGRISDHLNQSISEYVDCRNVHLMRNGQMVSTLPTLQIRKPNVLLAGLVAEVYEAPEKLIGNRRELEKYPVVLGIGRWIVRGFVHVPMKVEVKEFLRSERDFFPVSDAEVLDAARPENMDRSRVAIVNRTCVSFMEIGDPDEPSPTTGTSGVSRSADPLPSRTDA